MLFLSVEKESSLEMYFDLFQATIADLALFQAIEFLQSILDDKQKPEEDLIKNKDKLLAHRRKVMDIPAIKKYLSSQTVK